MNPSVEVDISYGHVTVRISRRELWKDKLLFLTNKDLWMSILGHPFFSAAKQHHLFLFTVADKVLIYLNIASACWTHAQLD